MYKTKEARNVVEDYYEYYSDHDGFVEIIKKINPDVKTEDINPLYCSARLSATQWEMIADCMVKDHAIEKEGDEYVAYIN